MFIQTESSPNPATLKFLPGLQVLESGTADFPAADQRKLFHDNAVKYYRPA